MNAELNTDRLVADLKRVVRDSEVLLEATSDTVGTKAQEVRERLTDALESAKRTCRQLEEKAIEGAKAAASIKDNRDWKEARPAQASVPEAELVKAVREILARHAASDGGVA